jgi:hypothetical protein
MRGPLIDRGLALLLRALAAGAAGRFRIVQMQSEEWASATFAGARHCVSLELEGDDSAGRAERLRAELPELDFALPRHLVADIVALPGKDAILSFEALILEEA